MKTAETRILYRDDWRRLCIARDWYTLGYSEEYEQLLRYADNSKDVSATDIVHIAKDIKLHSETDYPLSSICFDVAEICHSFFDVDEWGREL